MLKLHNLLVLFFSLSKSDLVCQNIIVLKNGYMGFARLKSSADAIHSAIVSPVVTMAAEVPCQRPRVAAHLHSAYRRVITSYRELYIAHL